MFNTTDGSQAVLCLETSGLGEYFGINHKMALKSLSHFGLSSDDLLCLTSKPIDFLLGIDATALLLDKIFILNGRKVGPPGWAPNVFLYGSPASDKFSLVGRLNIHSPVNNNKTSRASGIFYFSDEDKLVSCQTLIETNRYTHHVVQGNEPVTLSRPPPRVSGQVKNCEATPAKFVFTDNELVEIVSKGHVLRENPPTPMAMPHFVSLHKIFLKTSKECLRVWECSRTL